MFMKKYTLYIALICATVNCTAFGLTSGPINDAWYTRAWKNSFGQLDTQQQLWSGLAGLGMFSFGLSYYLTSRIDKWRTTRAAENARKLAMHLEAVSVIEQNMVVSKVMDTDIFLIPRTKDAWDSAHITDDPSLTLLCKKWAAISLLNFRRLLYTNSNEITTWIQNRHKEAHKQTFDRISKITTYNPNDPNSPTFKHLESIGRIPYQSETLPVNTCITQFVQTDEGALNIEHIRHLDLARKTYEADVSYIENLQLDQFINDSFYQILVDEVDPISPPQESSKEREARDLFTGYMKVKAPHMPTQQILPYAIATESSTKARSVCFNDQLMSKHFRHKLHGCLDKYI
jgi:hypothetical protein